VVTSEERARLGDELYRAMVSREVVKPLTERVAGLTIEDAYHVSRQMLSRRLDAGERVIGKKIGVTSPAVQNMLGVHQPDFGWLTDTMRFADGDEMPVSKELIQPRAEGELAFVLRDGLMGPNITANDVIAATEAVFPCFEVVDSRIADWRIRIEDTVADNASSGWFVLGTQGVAATDIDLVGCRMVVEKNGKKLSEGRGEAALGSPAISVAWLANTLSRFGIGLEPGEVILSGSLVPLEPVSSGDHMRCIVEGVGETSVRFC
jgi:2-oxopent-4-enoate/cis-2-oxohex-4-enoate hydratase